MHNPKNIVTWVAIVARISTTNQEDSALQAQVDLCRKYIEAHFAGPFKFVIIATQGSGEILDRSEILKLTELIDSRRVEIVVAEDLGRIMRRMQAYLICESCVDKDVRLIAINDKIDTCLGDWQLATIFAAMKHERSNTDTSARISRQLNFNFAMGRCIMHLPPGIARPASKSDADLKWDPRFAQLFRTMFFLCERGWSIVRLTDWLKKQGVDVDNKKVRRLLSNPIFIGERHRGMTVSHRTNRDGRRRKRAADPSNLKIRVVPQLKIICVERFKRVQQLLAQRGDKYIVGRNGRPDNRKGHARKQTAFPGQRIICGVCGRVWYWGGHGQTHHMSCSGERQYKCWATATFDGHEARKRICKAIVDATANLTGFDPLLVQTVRDEAGRCLVDRNAQRAELDRQLAQYRLKGDRLLAALSAGASTLELLVAELAKVEALMNDLKRQIEELDRAPKPTVTFPSIDELRTKLVVAMNSVLKNPMLVGTDIDRLVPSIIVRPVRIRDGGHVAMRATVELNLAALITPGEDLADRLPELNRTISVDLFNAPKRVEILPLVMKARADNPKATLRRIASSIPGVNVDMVRRAFKLGTLMKERGVTDPYEDVTEPSQMSGRHKKHSRAKFKFEPLAGYPTWLNNHKDREDRSAA